MSNFSFFGFQYGTPRKPPNKPAPQMSNISKERSKRYSFSRPSSQPKVGEVRYVFDKFDTNKDGRISREEYKSALKTLDKDIAEGEIAKTFKALDSDGDGFVGFTEFVEMFNMGNDEARKADIESAFRVFDLDGNGKISAEELSLVLKKLGENCSLGACRNMVKGVDSDGDGKQLNSSPHPFLQHSCPPNPISVPIRSFHSRPPPAFLGGDSLLIGRKSCRIIRIVGAVPLISHCRFGWSY
ncbi:hypothetical protein TB1_026702 [Malus domestica]